MSHQRDLGTDRFSAVRPLWLTLGPLLTAILYYLGAEGSLRNWHADDATIRAGSGPPNVVLLCALLVAPRRHWPLYVAAAFPAHVLAEQGVAMPLPQLLGCLWLQRFSITLLNAIAPQPDYCAIRQALEAYATRRFTYW